MNRQDHAHDAKPRTQFSARNGSEKPRYRLAIPPPMDGWPHPRLSANGRPLKTRDRELSGPEQAWTARATEDWSATPCQTRVWPGSQGVSDEWSSKPTKVWPGSQGVSDEWSSKPTKVWPGSQGVSDEWSSKPTKVWPAENHACSADKTSTKMDIASYAAQCGQGQINSPYTDSNHAACLFKQRTPEGHRRALHMLLHDAVRAAPSLPSVPWLLEADYSPPQSLKMDHCDGVLLMDSLKVFEQYARVLSQACHCEDSAMGKFLHGHPGAAQQPNLAWLETLCQPCAPLGPSECKRVEHQLDMHTTLHPALSRTDALGELFMEDPKHGDAFVRASLPEDCKGYHVEACKLHLLLDTKGPLSPSALSAYGALYPLLLCAKRMPSLNDWLPVEMHREAHQWEELLFELNSAATAKDALASVEARCANLDWSKGAGKCIAATLDRACILTRVHSGRCCDLDKAIGSFPLHPVAPEALWRKIVSEDLLQKCLPPSCLAPQGVKRPTWGLSSLRVKVLGSSVVIDGGKLEWLSAAKDKHASLESQSSTKSQEKTENSLAQSPDKPSKPDKGPAQQVSNVLSRMGEVALSSPMIYAMHSPNHAKYSLTTGRTLFKPNDATHNLFTDPWCVLRVNKEFPHPSEEDVFKFISALADRMPKVETIEFKTPHRLVGWRVDPPQRAVVFTGKMMGGFDIKGFAPHTLKKTIIADEKPSASSVSCISLVHDDICEKDVGALLAHYVSTKLPKLSEENQSTHTRLSQVWEENQSTHTKLSQLYNDSQSTHTKLSQLYNDSQSTESDPPHATQTALLEGMAVFTTSQPILRTEVPLRGSASWDNEHEDARYAETQTGDNGFRYREWVAIYSDAKQILKCKLESHMVSATKIYATTMPWCRLDGETEWVSVAASAKPDVKVLHERAEHKNGSFASFVCSVKARFLQDLKMLPLRKSQEQRVDRQDVAVYTNEDCGQIMLAYAPTEDQRVEFILFQRQK